ncbi:MAG: hypothetical protein ACUVUD_07410 [bacterium]
MYRLGLIFFFLGAVWAQDTIWVRQYDLGSDEQLIGIANQGERVVSVGSYTDPENYDWEALIVWFNQSGEALKMLRIDFGGDEELLEPGLQGTIQEAFMLPAIVRTVIVDS